MIDFLDEMRREIAVQMDKLKPLVEEYRQLEAAAAALAGIPAAANGVSGGARRGPGRPRGSTTTATPAPTPVSPRPAPTAKPAPKRKRGRRKRAGGRAQQALALIRAEPGIAISELAQRMGVKGSYLYRILPPLEQAGKIEKQGRGWHPGKA